jgi:hypothetical protein
MVLLTATPCLTAVCTMTSMRSMPLHGIFRSRSVKFRRWQSQEPETQTLCHSSTKLTKRTPPHYLAWRDDR